MQKMNIKLFFGTNEIAVNKYWDSEKSFLSPTLISLSQFFEPLESPFLSSIIPTINCY